MASCTRTLAGVLVGLVVVVGRASGEARTWVGGHANGPTAWSLHGNWNPAGVPAAGDDVTIPDTVHDPVLDTNPTIRNLTLQRGAGLTIAGHNLAVGGGFSQDFSATGTGLVLTDPSDEVTIEGDATFASTAGGAGASTATTLTAGVLRIRGNLAIRTDSWQGTDGAYQCFSVTGTQVILDGSAAQTINDNAPGADRHYFADVEISNPLGVTLLTDLWVTGRAVLTGGGQLTATAGKTLYTSTHLPRAGAGYSVPNTCVRGAITLDEDIDLSNAAAGLTIDHSLTINGHRLTVGGGLTVHFDTTGRGLVMTHPADAVTVGGSALFHSNAGGEAATTAGSLTAGTLRINGNFRQQTDGWQGTNGTPHTFDSTGTAVVFGGTTAQSVTFDAPGADRSRFADLTISNPAGVNLTTSIYVTGRLALTGGGVLTGTDAYYTTRLPRATPGYQVTNTRAKGAVVLDEDVTLSNPGNHLVIENSVQVNGHTLTVGGGLTSLFNTTGNTLVMTNPADRVVVGGNVLFTTNSGGSAATTEGSLTAGELHIRGHFHQQQIAHQGTNGGPYAFVATGSHTTVFDGSAPQEIRFDSPGADRSRFQQVQVSNALGVQAMTDVYVLGQLTMVGSGVLTGPHFYYVNHLPDANAGYAPTTSHVVGAISLTGDVSIPATSHTLAIEPGGRLTVGGHQLNLGGGLSLNFAVTGNGLLLQHPADEVIVGGTLNISSNAGGGAGATSQGNYSAGTLRLRGNFHQWTIAHQGTDGNGREFVTTGTRTIFEGTTQQTLQLENPHPDRNRFWDLELRNPAGVKVVGNHVCVADQLVVPAGTGAVLTADQRYEVWCGGFNVNGLTVDRLALWLRSGAPYTGQVDLFDNVHFRTYQTDWTPLRLDHPGTARRWLFTGLSWDTTPTTGWFVSATDTAADANQLRVYLYQATPADGAARTTTGGGAEVIWTSTPPNDAPGQPLLQGPADGTVFTDAPVPLRLAAEDLNGDALHYRVEILSGDTVVQTWDHAQSLLGWDQAFAYAAGQTATLNVTGLTNGAYSWRATADDGSATGPVSALGTFVVALPVGVTQVLPGTIRQGAFGLSELQITGRGFADGTLVSLLQGTQVHSAQTVTFQDPTALRAAFDLSTLPAGAYDLQVVTPDSATATLAGALTVVPGADPEVEVHLIAPNTIQAERVVPIGLSFTNRSQVPSSGTLIALVLPPSSTVAADWFTHADDAVLTDEALVVPLLLPGLPPGGSGYLPLTLQVGLLGDYFVSVHLFGSAPLAPAPVYDATPISPSRADCPTCPAPSREYWPPYWTPTATAAHPWSCVEEADVDALHAVWDKLKELAPSSNFTKRWTKDACAGVQRNTIAPALKTIPELQGWHMISVDCVWGAGAGHTTTLIVSPTTNHGYLVDNYLKPSFAPVMQRARATGSRCDHFIIDSNNRQCKALLDTGNPLVFLQNKAYRSNHSWSTCKTDCEAYGPEDWIKIGGGKLAVAPADAGRGREGCGEGGCPVPLRTTTRPLKVLRARDPNDKSGSAGVGEARYLAGTEELSYTIHFENVADATGPAQEVVVTDPLDATKLDVTTFALSAVTFGDQAIAPPPGTQTLDQLVDLRPGRNLLVRVEARLDPATNTLTWRFTSLDPATGQLPVEATEGFLPPNVAPPEGEGMVTFTIRPLAGLPTGTVIANRASIVFDVNAPLETNAWTNTIDGEAPTSTLAALPANSPPEVDLSWTAGDQAGGAGLAQVEVWVSANDGPYALQLTRQAGEADATFTGRFGDTYRFYTVAVDQAGNREAVPALGGVVQPEAVTRIGPAPTLSAGLQMLSLPLVPEQADPQAVLGFTGSRFARWNPASGTAGGYARYAAAFTLFGEDTPGKSYWIESDTARQLDLRGRALTTETEVAIPLATGWNQIADPFLAAVEWDLATLRVRVGGVDRTLGEAGDTLAPYAWTWRLSGDPPTGAYRLVGDADLIGAGGLHQLEPWQGYFVKALAACELVVPRPAAAVARAARTAPGAWSATLQAGVGESVDAVRLGWNQQAALQAGRPPDPPGRAAGVRAWLGEPAAALAVDLRRGATTQTWSWQVAAEGQPAETEVVLSWPALLRELPRGVVLQLEDGVTGRVVLLNTSAAYRYRTARPGEVRALTVTATRGAVTRSAITSLAAQPTRGRGVALTLTLSGPAEVHLVVRGLGGRLVREVVSQAAEGTVQLAWDGLDQTGRPVAAGLYQVEATAVTANGALSRVVRTVAVR